MQDCEQAYEMLRIKRNGRFTIAFVMNFCLYPKGIFITGSNIIIHEYEIGELGENKERFLDNKRIEGTIKCYNKSYIKYSYT